MENIIAINNKEENLLFDTGNDLPVMSYQYYINIGSPNLYSDDITLIGIGRETINPFGHFVHEISVDGFLISTKCVF